MLALTRIRRALPLIALPFGFLATAACSTGSSGIAGGGPVAGAQDTHCAGMMPQPTNQGDCGLMASADAGPPMGPTYGATMYNSSGDDDDCKYHVSWTAQNMGRNQDVTFNLTVAYQTDGMPNPPACANCPVVDLSTQNTELEVFLNDTHPAPPTNQVVSMSDKGAYGIGPIQFDAPGQWTVRFHVFELCTDVADDSPHGHAAFYVQVP